MMENLERLVDVKLYMQHAVVNLRTTVPRVFSKIFEYREPLTTNLRKSLRKKEVYGEIRRL